jgi:glycosyltransferase involved in cell wall biosynthesis
MVIMKIVHINDYYMDGWGYQENILPIYQKEMGHEIIFITSDLYRFPINNKRKTNQKEYYSSGIKIYRLKSKFELKKHFVIYKDLSKLLFYLKPDYIFCHEGITSLYLREVIEYKKKYPKTILVADNHADLINISNNKLYKFLYYKLFIKNYLKKYIVYFDKFYSITEEGKDFAENFLGIPPEKHELLYLGSDIKNNYFDKSLREKYRKLYDINDKDILFITLGKMNEKKRIDLLIKAFSKIKNNNIKLFIVGSIDKNYEGKIDSLIKNDKRIYKIGWIDSINFKNFLSAADVAIFPNGRTVIWQQCLACNLPLIIKYSRGAEYILSKKNGFFLYSDSYLEIKQILELIINNKDLILQMKNGTKELVDKLLSYEIIAKKTLDFKG